jgi:hypothetical protein
MLRSFTFASVATALTLLAACQPSPPPPAPPAPITPPAATEAPMSTAETLALSSDKGVITFRFGGGAVVTAKEIGPVGPVRVLTDRAAPGVALRQLLLAPTEATPVTGYRVTAEAGSAPLCGAKPTVAVVVAFAKPVRVAAVTGGLPGEAGAMLCNVQEVEIAQP